MDERNRQCLNELADRVHPPMLRAVEQARLHGVHAQIFQAHMATGKPSLPTVHLDLSLSQSMVLSASFRVHWEYGWWVVQRRMFQHTSGGLRRVRSPSERFRTLPAAQWFDEEIQKFLEHEKAVGILQLESR